MGAIWWEGPDYPCRPTPLLNAGRVHSWHFVTFIMSCGEARWAFNALAVLDLRTETQSLSMSHCGTARAGQWI